MALEYTATYKILILGDSNVGKTCMVHRFCDERYYDMYISTIGIDFKQKIIILDGTPVKLQIWDTAGQERFRTLTTAYYRGAMGILLMYDVTNLESYNHLTYWLKNIEENASADVVTVLAGNKCEANERCVETASGEKVIVKRTVCNPHYNYSCARLINIKVRNASLAYSGCNIAENFELPFIEVSCKDNINVEESFLILARRIREQTETNGEAYQESYKENINDILQQHSDGQKQACSTC